MGSIHALGRRGAAAALVALALAPASTASAEAWAPQLAGPRVLHADADGNLDPWPVAPDGSRHTVRVSSETRKVGDKDVVFMVAEHVHRARDGREQVVRFGEWSTEDERPTTWSPIDVRPLPDGRCLALVERTRPVDEKSWASELWLLTEGAPSRTLDAPVVTDAHLFVDPKSEPIVVMRRGSTIELWYAGRTTKIAEDSDYDWSVAIDGRGRLSVLRYAQDTRAFFVHSTPALGGTWQSAVIDGREAGWQHSLALHGDQLWTLYYYYRNAFNKGLKLAVIEDGQVARNTTFRREEETNLGWEPLLGARADGSLRVSFLEDVDEGRRAELAFDSLDAMLANHPAEVTGSWTDEARFVEVEAGVRPGLQWWHVGAPDPPEDESPVRYSPSYRYDPGLVTSVFVSARIGSVHLGATYAQDLLGRTVESEAGPVARRALQLFSGTLGFDELFAGHDVRVTWERAKVEGEYVDATSQRDADTRLDFVEFALINQWRVKYGLQFRAYDLTEPIYGYYAAPNDPKYTFVGADVVDASIKRIELFLGYSRLDYLTKYETRFFGPVWELGLGGGLGISTFPDIQLGGREVGSNVQLALSASARVGLAYYQRFRALRGAGAHVSLGYQAWGLSHGFTTGKPDDRKSETDEEREALTKEDFQSKVAHFQLFHGPYLSVGVVY
ncbi:hypothetical protein L6R52_11405 [Myxococcota bacterium]|nr:hypothetical protein [Myxococcota bacterium]